MKDYSIDGDYTDARMIGSTVHMVTREQSSPTTATMWSSRLSVKGQRPLPGRNVWYFDNHESHVHVHYDHLP